MGSLVTRCCKTKKPTPASPTNVGLKVLAAQTLKIASINGLGDTEKIETELEDEIRWEESRSPPKEIIGRLQRKCEEVVHSKQVLLLVIILNVLDCLLIMSEMTLEFYHVSSLYFDRQTVDDDFLLKMKSQYPVALQDPKISVVNLFNRIMTGFVLWISSSHSIDYFRNDCANFLNATSAFSFNLSREGNSTSDRPEDLDVSLLDQILNGTRNSIFYDNSSFIQGFSTFNDSVKIIHSLHYGSISILSVLVAETLLKILCIGRRFFKKKMEVFDAVIILISFTLDLIFVEGLTNFEVPNFIIILSLLLPWRILRVLNSLIVAVMDQQRFHMKLLYKQKRKVTKQLSEATEKIKVLEKQVEALKDLCLNKGVQEWELNKITGQVNGQGGMKALSKLIFQAADAFAPMSSPQLNGGRSFLKDDTSSAHSLDSHQLEDHVTNGDVVQRWGEGDERRAAAGGSADPEAPSPTLWLTDSSGNLDVTLNDEDFISRL